MDEQAVGEPTIQCPLNNGAKSRPGSFRPSASVRYRLMVEKEASRERERTAQHLRALTSALRTAYPAEPSRSFNADMASLLDAIDKRDKLGRD